MKKCVKEFLENKELMSELRDELFNYGYYWLGMQKIGSPLAELLIQDKKPMEIYKLYEDNTESLVESLEDFKCHKENGGEFGVELEDYDDYVVFVLGRDLLKGILPYENDIAYEWCVNIAKDFEISKFNVNTKGLYECLEEYVKENFCLNKNGVISFKGHDLYEVIGGVRRGVEEI